MRVAYVLKMFPRLSETFILNEVLELERQGIALRIFSLKRPTDGVAHSEGARVRAPISYLPERLAQEPVRILRAQAAVFFQHPLAYVRTLARALPPRRGWALRRRLKRFVQACCLIEELGGVGHLHAHFATGPSRVALLAHRMTGVPYSVTTHAKDVHREGPRASAGLRAKLGPARFVVANSRYSAAHLRARLATAGAPRVLTIYNGINLDAFRWRQEEPAVPLILSVGRLVEKKGHAVLVQACRHLKEWRVGFRCEIVGAGPLGPELERLVRGNGLDEHVRLVGPLPHEDLGERYRRAMVFVLPCTVAADGDRDVLPNVLKEAMAVGVPVVTTRLAGIEELVADGETGLLVPAGDAWALARALERLLSDPSLRRRLAARARAVIEERFDRRITAAHLKGLFLEALSHAAARGAAAAAGPAAGVEVSYE